jgi:hypothetical protein
MLYTACLQICGIDRSKPNYTWNDVVNLMQAHMERLRSRYVFRDSHIFLYGESQMSTYTVEIIKDIVCQPRFGSTQCVDEFRQGRMRPGVTTNDEDKERYAKSLATLFSNGWISYATDENFISEDAQDNKEEMLKQLRIYRREEFLVKNAQSGEYKKKVVYSGKGSGMKDDLAMDLQIAVGQSLKMRASPAYQQLALQRGWRF